MLGGGGQGDVYRDKHRPEYVLKLLHEPNKAVEDKIRAMLASPPQLQTHRDGTGPEFVQIAWPQELLIERSGRALRFIGFSMRFLDTRETVEINAWFDPLARRRNGLPQDDRLRVYLAANLASVAAYIHQAGHAIADIKPQNILAYRKHGFTCLVDCDGFSIRSGKQVFPATMATLNYVAPEHQTSFDPARLDEAHDRFALAVMIFLLLDNNRHPASGSSNHLPTDYSGRLALGAVFLDPNSGLTPPKLSHSPYFADETISLFKRAFTSMPRERPASTEWRDHLRRLAQSMRPCGNSGAHWHYGKGCPWCALKIRDRPHSLRRAARDLSPKLVPNLRGLTRTATTTRASPSTSHTSSKPIPVNYPRRWWVALPMSLLAPGLGQLYNGDLQKAVICFYTPIIFPAILFVDYPINLILIASIFLLIHSDAVFQSINKRIFVKKKLNRVWVYVLALVSSWALTLLPIILTQPIIKISGSSMRPVLLHQDRVLVNILYSNPVLRGDVVVFTCPQETHRYCIARIVGLPSEQFEINAGIILINGQALVEPYIFDDLGRTPDMAPTPIPEGHFWVLGDSRANSNDSRNYGPVPIKNIHGRASYVYWPNERRGFIRRVEWSSSLGSE